MQIHFGLDLFPKNIPTIVTIGIFDGVHLAHQELLQYLNKKASSKGLQSVLVSFSPHPRTILSNSPVQLLSTDSEKIQLIENQNIDHLILIEFTKQFSEISAKTFLETILIEKLGAKEIVLGYDHHFGKNREGNIELLRKFEPQFGYKVTEIAMKVLNGLPVNSSNVRKLILEGNMEQANVLLGRKYSFSGKVIEGKKLGRTIGFPTANIALDFSQKLIPAKGVYAVKLSMQNSDKVYSGMMNIGNRPTVNGLDLSIEVNIFDFNADIYQQKITIYPLKKLREEQKFASIDDLKQQLHFDKNTAIQFLN